jgi:hypothetical protein
MSGDEEEEFEIAEEEGFEIAEEEEEEEEFAIDVGELGESSKWRPLPRSIYGRQELRRLLDDLAGLLLDSANVVYLRVRRVGEKKTERPTENDD